MGDRQRGRLLAKVNWALNCVWALHHTPTAAEIKHSSSLSSHWQLWAQKLSYFHPLPSAYTRMDWSTTQGETICFEIKWKINLKHWFHLRVNVKLDVFFSRYVSSVFLSGNNKIKRAPQKRGSSISGLVLPPCGQILNCKRWSLRCRITSRWEQRPLLNNEIAPQVIL